MNSSFINFFSKHSYLLSISIVVLTIITLFLTLSPGGMLKGNIWSHDKLGHMLMFGSWTFLLGLYIHLYHSHRSNLVFLFFTGLSFGIAVELLQYILPINRDPDFIDVIFDGIGCFFAVLLLRFYFSRLSAPDETLKSR